MNLPKYSAHKKYGIMDFSPDARHPQFVNENKGLAKIIYLQAGGRLHVDLAEFKATKDELFFIHPGQYIQLGNNSNGSILYYAPHLYLTELDDHDLFLGGMFFNGIEEKSGLKLDDQNSLAILSFFKLIRSEMGNLDADQEAMICMLVKQLIITSIRIWKIQYGAPGPYSPKAAGFVWFFEQLVNRNFIEHHTVSSYAKMLNISPKALSKKVAKYSGATPSHIIRQRIILEAKRMLVHTPLSVKEIGYKLGYEDPSYFIRFFSKQVKLAPQNFRKYFQSALNAVA